jgi:hypothetical protein
MKNKNMRIEEVEYKVWILNEELQVFASSIYKAKKKASEDYIERHPENMLKKVALIGDARVKRWKW